MAALVFVVATAIAWLPTIRAIAVSQQPRVSPADAPFSCCDELVKGPRLRGSGKNASAIPLFAIERTGLQGSGLMGGEIDRQPAMCLTATDKPDRVGGFGMRLQPCESSFDTFGATVPNNKSPELRQQQLFVLGADGSILSAGTWLCVRRVRCGDRFLYDLGRCDGPGYVAIYEVDRAAAASVDHLMPLGTLAQAVKMESCINCGAYILKERCLTRGERYPSSHGRTCGEHWQGKPGFTKLPSTYVGDAIANGRTAIEDTYEGPYDRIVGVEEANELAGMMATDFDGICGSYITDGPTMDSVFYVHRQV
mmetsp:Transcript_31119/g.89987  ORF Transcript_31119/g.89987 Transcript_31119/m.89987 type:complete len:309 (-) Transcript_31119:101-1027(-)